MKKFVTLTLLSGSLLSGCAVSPMYDGPVVVAPAPVYVAPAPAIVVRPSFGISYYRGPWGRYHGRY